jgi:hypothetical protein
MEVVTKMREVFIGGEAPDAECYNWMAPQEHLIQSTIISAVSVVVIVLAYRRLSPANSAIPPFREGPWDKPLAALVILVEGLTMYQRTLQVTLCIPQPIRPRASRARAVAHKMHATCGLHKLEPRG